MDTKKKIKASTCYCKIPLGRLVVDGKSILGLLLLGATWKSKLIIEAEGHDAENAIQGIEAFFLIQESCADALD